MLDPGNSAWLENAVRIYGPREGGTTLFQNLLDGSSQLFFYPAELKLKYLSKAGDMTPSEYFLNSKVPANDRRVVPETTASGEWEARSYFRHIRENNVDVEAFDWAAYQAEWMADPDWQQIVGQLVRKDAITVFRNSRFHATSPVGWCTKQVGGRPGRIMKLWKKSFQTACSC
jgi:hypothetical protein